MCSRFLVWSVHRILVVAVLLQVAQSFAFNPDRLRPRDPSDCDVKFYRYIGAFAALAHVHDSFYYLPFGRGFYEDGGVPRSRTNILQSDLFLDW